MHSDERRRIIEDGGLKNFTRVDDARVNTTDVCPMDGNDAILRVKQDDEEDFTVIVLDEAFGDTECVLR